MLHGWGNVMSDMVCMHVAEQMPHCCVVLLMEHPGPGHRHAAKGSAAPKLLRKIFRAASAALWLAAQCSIAAQAVLHML